MQGFHMHLPFLRTPLNEKLIKFYKVSWPASWINVKNWRDRFLTLLILCQRKNSSCHFFFSVGTRAIDYFIKSFSPSPRNRGRITCTCVLYFILFYFIFSLHFRLFTNSQNIIIVSYFRIYEIVQSMRPNANIYYKLCNWLVLL